MAFVTACSADKGVNAYVEPVVSLDLDVVIAVEQLPEIERILLIFG